MPTRPVICALSLALVAGCPDSPPIVTDAGPLSDATWEPDAAAPTFTWLYDNMFHGYCADRNQPCHNPGANRGVSFSTRDRAFASLQDYLVPGDAFASDVYYFISDGMMPPFNPRVPADLQARLAAWIDAGAPNN